MPGISGHTIETFLAPRTFAAYVANGPDTRMPSPNNA